LQIEKIVMIMVQSYLKRNNFLKLSPKAVFFDMDGILFDSMPHHTIAWVKAMNDSGLPFTQKEAYMYEGQPGVDTINNVFRRVHGKESTEEERTAIYELKGKYFNKLGEPKRIPFALEMTQKLKEKGYLLYVVTGSAHPTLIDNIQNYFPDIFPEENIISAFDVPKGKPNPDPYLKALRLSKAQPWEAVVVENAPLGVQSSSTAQIFTIGVNTGPLEKNVLTDSGADIVLDSMKELFEKWDDFNF